MLPRRYVLMPDLDKKPEATEKKILAWTLKQYPEKKYEEVAEEDANLVTSEITYYKRRKLHAPALDIDIPMQVYESSTPGHHHLLIDVPMPWWRYRLLLRSLWKAGIIEEGYYKTSVKRKATFLRKQGVLKPGTAGGAKVEQPQASVLTWQ